MDYVFQVLMAEKGVVIDTPNAALVKSLGF